MHTGLVAYADDSQSDSEERREPNMKRSRTTNHPAGHTGPVGSDATGLGLRRIRSSVAASTKQKHNNTSNGTNSNIADVRAFTATLSPPRFPRFCSRVLSVSARIINPQDRALTLLQDVSGHVFQRCLA